jgi:hypothetical protein
VEPKPDPKRKAIASFVLGVVSMIPFLELFVHFFFKISLPFISFLFIPLVMILAPYTTGIIGFFLGRDGLKSSKKNFAKAGIALSIIGIVSYILFFMMLYFGGIGR